MSGCRVDWKSREGLMVQIIICLTIADQLVSEVDTHSQVFLFLCGCVCLQVLQWLIIHADTIQSLLRCQELNMGVLQELSLLTGIISKTALPGTIMTMNLAIYCATMSLFPKLLLTHFSVSQVRLRWEERSATLLFWSSRVTLTDSRFDSHHCF